MFSLFMSGLLMVSSVTGTNNEFLQVSKAVIKSGETITITGKNFDPKVGIYLALCKVPNYGEMPTPCGGGVDTDGSTKSSIWISNKPPAYGKNLVNGFGSNGSFKFNLKLKSNFADINCKKVKCAITVRADHTRSDNRNYDLFIPIKFI